MIIGISYSQVLKRYIITVDIRYIPYSLKILTAFWHGLTSNESMLRFWVVASVFLITLFLGRVGRVSPDSKTSSGKSKLFRVRANKAAQTTNTYLRTWMIDRSLIPGWKPAQEVHVDLKI